jgi:hypothetical protein
MLRLHDQDKIQEQEKLIQKLTAELSELRKEHHPCTASVMAIDSDTMKGLKGTISYTMNAMLDCYESLDGENKTALFNYAISSGNENLQSWLLMLRDTHKKTGTSSAKLTKDIIQIADTHKVPELKFDEQASKCRFNYQAWIMKLQPILAMFPQTATVLPRDKVIPYADPTAMGAELCTFNSCSALIHTFNAPFANLNTLVTKRLNFYKSSVCI